MKLFSKIVTMLSFVLLTSFLGGCDKLITPHVYNNGTAHFKVTNRNTGRFAVCTNVHYYANGINLTPDTLIAHNGNQLEIEYLPKSSNSKFEFNVTFTLPKGVTKKVSKDASFKTNYTISDLPAGEYKIICKAISNEVNDTTIIENGEIEVSIPKEE